MQWIIDNWLVLLLGGGMIAMHLFGHGRGGHGGHGKHKPEQDAKAGNPAEQDPDRDR